MRISRHGGSEGHIWPITEGGLLPPVAFGKFQKGQLGLGEGKAHFGKIHRVNASQLVAGGNVLTHVHVLVQNPAGEGGHDFGFHEIAAGVFQTSLGGGHICLGSVQLGRAQNQVAGDLIQVQPLPVLISLIGTGLFLGQNQLRLGQIGFRYYEFRFVIPGIDLQ